VANDPCITTIGTFFSKILEVGKGYHDPAFFGYIENECCFSLVSFLKNKLHNHLNPHLELLVVMYYQKFFTLENFPCQANYDLWTDVSNSHG
jgi:hypothetical protein